MFFPSYISLTDIVNQCNRKHSDIISPGCRWHRSPSWTSNGTPLSAMNKSGNHKFRQ